MNKKKTRISLIIVALVFVLSIVTSVVSFADDSIDINETNFTDPVFRAAIKLNYDLDNDDKLSPEERNVTTMLVSGLVDELAESRGVDVDTLTISSLKGIEYFDNLRALYCGHIGELESLDVSSLSQLETLNCSDNGLTSLDVSANTELKMLYCMSNEFTELDFSANSNLELIHCYTNLNLKSLNVNSLTNLEELRCDVCQLTSLDLSTNTALDALNCSYNRLSKLDLSNTDISSLTDYNLGNQNISLELIYEDGLIKAPIDLDAASVYSTSLDEDEKAFKDGAFFTTDYSKVENGFSYLYSTGKSGCAEMNVSVSTYHTHTYAVSASDKENKKLTVKCQICGLEHVLDADVSSVTTDAGCVTDGETKYTVTAEFESVTYSDVITVVIPALGHHYVATVTDPTCLEQGYTTYKCSRCDDSYVDDYVDPLGHAFGDWTEEAPAVAPKCLEAGKTAVDKRTCTRCDAYETRGGTEVPALGHDIVDAVTQPTCTEQGYTTHTCTRCDYVSVDTYTDPLGHTDGAPVRENEVEAKCLINGSYDEVTYCTVCKAETSRTPHNIDALGHNFGDWFVVEEEVKPTCTNKGKTAVERRNCTRCEEYETKGGADINPLG
ncbi:MAG: hypothetical protein IKF64_03160, partial [Eubacterium sp.]|nr:hypothetical protein [Eubacterium sp.]